MGKVMRVLMPKVKGAADGKAVNEKVKEALSCLEGKAGKDELQGYL